MRLVVDLAFQDLLGRRDSDGRYLATQLFASLVGFLLDFGLRRSELTLALLDAGVFAIGNNFVGARMGLVEYTDVA